MNGYKKTGITIMYMDVKMDTGDIISTQEIEILDTDTGSSLHDKLMFVARDLLISTLPSIIDGTATRTSQDESEATYAFTIKRDHERIDFDDSKKQIYNKVRALNSWPGAYCFYEGKILKVWQCYLTDNIFTTSFNGEITNIYEDGFGVKTSNGEIVITEVQPEGKSKMKATDFINGEANKGNLVGKVLD
jgi:methionyl-tRNA formyltransferase